MDNETAKYITDYFSVFLTEQEKIAIKHTISTSKLENSAKNMADIFKRNGWTTEDKEVLDLLKNGYDEFEIRAATRILSENSDKIFLNNCPKCDKLARTPKAKQCRHCAYNWHKTNE